MLNDDQIHALQQSLDQQLIRIRRKNDLTFPYIEGHTIINQANRIFGYGNWSGTILSLELIDRGMQETSKGMMHFAYYTCVYQITVFDQHHHRSITHSDVGFGSGFSYSNLGEAIESAAKEAVTDAMKRTFRNWGDQFGLNLYGGAMRSSSSPPSPRRPR